MDETLTAEPLEHTSINEAVSRRLRDHLMRGDYAIGQVLGIQELADATGTHMAVLRAVRDSFNRAKEQGLDDHDLSAIVQVPWPSQPADIAAGGSPGANGKAAP